MSWVFFLCWATELVCIRLFYQAVPAVQHPVIQTRSGKSPPDVLWSLMLTLSGFFRHESSLSLFRRRTQRKWSPMLATFNVWTLSITHLQICLHRTLAHSGLFARSRGLWNCDMGETMRTSPPPINRRQEGDERLPIREENLWLIQQEIVWHYAQNDNPLLSMCGSKLLLRTSIITNECCCCCSYPHKVQSK